MPLSKVLSAHVWFVGLCASLLCPSAADAADGAPLLLGQPRILEESTSLPLAQAPLDSDNADYAVELQETTACSLITGDNVNIRRGPGLEYTTVTQLNSGDGVRAEYRAGNWVKLAARVFGFPPGENEPFDGWVVFEPFDGWVFNQFIDGCLEQADRWRTAQPEAQSSVLALDSEGLRLVNPSTGSTRALPFGLADSDLVSVLTNLRGEPSERGLNPECGAGPLTITGWPDGLAVLSSEGEFAGWVVSGGAGAERLTTLNGIGVGLTRRELDQIVDADVQESTLGFEFFEGGLGGILSGDSPDAEVTLLYSGTTCFFR